MASPFAAVVMRPGDRVLVTVDGDDDDLHSVARSLNDQFPGVEFVVTNEIAQVVPYVDASVGDS